MDRALTEPHERCSYANGFRVSERRPQGRSDRRCSAVGQSRRHKPSAATVFKHDCFPVMMMMTRPLVLSPPRPTVGLQFSFQSQQAASKKPKCFAAHSAANSRQPLSNELVGTEERLAAKEPQRFLSSPDETLWEDLASVSSMGFSSFSLQRYDGLPVILGEANTD